MDFFKDFTGSVTKAVNFVVDKNRKTAMINRLKIVIKSEKETQMSAYAELGKYYYKNMRDSENEQTEPFCAAVDNTANRLNRAFTKLDELIAPACCDDDFDEDAVDGEADFDEDESCSCSDECDCRCNDTVPDSPQDIPQGSTADIPQDGTPDDSFEGFPRSFSASQPPYDGETDLEEAADDDHPPVKP